MAWKTSTATDYKDLLDQLLDLLIARAAVGAVTPGGGNVGNGTLTELISESAAPTETWTLDCSSAAKVGVANYGTTVAGDTPVLHWRFNEGSTIGVADYSVTVLADTPILYWRLDEVSGTLANDQTANNLDGTISGTPTMGVTGLLANDTNKALQFDGTDDKVVSTAAALIQITGNITGEWVLNQSDNTGTQCVMAISNDGALEADNTLLQVQIIAGFVVLTHEYGTGSIETVATGIEVISGIDYHMAVTRDVATNDYYLYLNGIEEYNWSYTNDPTGGTSSYLSIGVTPGGVDFFDGIIDEPAIYASALSAATVLQHAKDAVGVSANVTVVDETVNNLDGTGTFIQGNAGFLSVDTNEAFNFNGINAKVVSAADSLVQITADLTVECLISPVGLTGTETIIGIGAAGTAKEDNYLVLLQLEDGCVKISHEYAAGLLQTRTSGILLETGLEYHIALSRDVSTNTYSLLIDGRVVYTFVYIFPPSDGTNSFVTVGMDADGNNKFSGVIDEVAIYSATMSAATALTHAKAAKGHETFTVTGSVSGVQTNAFVGIRYTNTYLSFLLNDGTTDFALSDDFTFGFTIGDLAAQAWAINRRDKETVFLEGPGSSGTDNIYITLHTYENVGADYYNWEILGNDGYVADQDKDGQVNVSPPSYVPLLNNTMTYWFVASGRRFIVIAKTSTNYHGCYGGLFLPFATPTQYPYPIFIGGSTGIETAKWSNNTWNSTVAVDTKQTSFFWFPLEGCAYLRKIDATWSTCSNERDSIFLDRRKEIQTHPYELTNRNSSDGLPMNLADLREDLSGNYPMMSITLLNNEKINSDEGVWGELDSCFYVTGFGNAAENIINDGTFDYLVVQNTFKTADDHYMALRLD